MDHIHDPFLLINNTIRCRTCGEILPNMEEEITKVSSSKRATKVLQEVAVAGRYVARSFEREFVLYTRDTNGIREEVTAEKLSDRNYRVFKRIVNTGKDD